MKRGVRPLKHLFTHTLFCNKGLLEKGSHKRQVFESVHKLQGVAQDVHVFALLRKVPSGHPL